MDYPYRFRTRLQPEELKERFEETPHEYIIMVGGGSPYGSRIGQGSWTGTVYYLGYIDLTDGRRVEGKHIFSWTLTDAEFDERLPAQLFQEGIKYRIRALPVKKGDGFCVLELLGTVRKMPYLDGLWKEYLTPVYMHSELFGELELNKRYEYFSCRFSWLGTDIEVSFSTDEEENEKCLANLEEFCRDCERRDNEIRDYAAQKLTWLANEWRDDDHLDETITEENFKRRLKISSIEMSADGYYTVWFDDDGMFAGHSVQVCGHDMGAPDYAELAG